MRIAILGTFPIHMFADQLGLRHISTRRTMAANVTLAMGLAEYAGADLHYVTTSVDAWEDLELHEGKFHLYVPKYNKRANLVSLFQFDIQRMLRLVRQIHPDVVLGIGTEHIYPLVATISGYPYAIMLHGIMSELVRNVQNVTFRQSCFALLERFVVWRTRYLVSISPYVTEVLRTQHNFRRHIFPIDCAAPLYFFENAGGPRSDKRLLFVGDGTPRKGLLDVIQVFARVREHIPDVELWIVGVRPHSKKPYTKRALHLLENIGHERVRIIEYSPHRELAGVMRSASVLLLLSQQETAPGVIFEAMASGTPVVTTALCGMPFMVRHGKTGFLVPLGDVAGATEYVVDLLGSPGKWEAMSSQCRREAMGRWHPSVLSEKLIDAFEYILSDSKT